MVENLFLWIQNLDDWNINIDEVKKINSKTKCIIVPHLYGLPAKIDELKKFVKRRILRLLKIQQKLLD